MLTLIDYGLGNIQAFAEIYKRLDTPFLIARSGDELAGATKLILPGVGSFDWAMRQLEASGMRPKLDELVLEREVPVLGVCVGMQMMARGSDEGHLPGLGWIPAEVKRLEGTADSSGRVPHMGWNEVSPSTGERLFAELPNPRFYFLHSYYFAPDHSIDVVGTSDYLRTFASAVRSGHVYGVQFHPEKSHGWGVQLLRNFAEF